MDGRGNTPFRIWDDDGVVRSPRIKGKVSRVIRIVLRNGIWELAARVIVSVKHVFDSISGLRSS